MNENYLQQIIQRLPEGLILVSKEQKIIFWNKWMEDKSAIKSDQAVGRSIADLFPDLAGGRICQSIETALSHRQSSFLSHTINKNMFPLFEINQLSGDKVFIYHNVSVSHVGEDSDPVALIYIHNENVNVNKEKALISKAKEEKELNRRLHKEIEERIKAEQKLKLSAAVIEYTTEGVVITDPASVVESVNPSFTKITGYSSADIVGKKIRILNSRKLPREYYVKLWQQLLSYGHWQGEFINKKPDGTLFIVESFIAAITDETGKITHYVNVFHDITQRKKDEELLEKLSRTDSLTGLANRRVFDEALAMHWSHCIRHSHRIAIAMIDVDHFKLYNDCYGHQMGDESLKKLGKVFHDHIQRSEDVIARYGGEEFVAIFLETEPEGVFKLMENIRNAVMDLKILHDHSETAELLTISIGVAYTIPVKAMLSKTLLSLADSALYEAKHKGRNQTVMHELMADSSNIFL